jgi:hypothetical protein
MTDRTPAIDLSRHQFKRELHGLAIFGTWVWHEDQQTHEPCLVVINAVYPRAFKPVVVALSAAYLYNDATYMAQRARQFVQLLGLHDSMVTAHKVALLIEDHLQDLITMPPNPTETVVVADASIKANGKSRSLEILDFVNKPQA